MQRTFHPDYPDLNCRTEGIIRNDNDFEKVDIYYTFWAKAGTPAKDFERLEERFKEDRETWLRDVGPDPQ